MITVTVHVRVYRRTGRMAHLCVPADSPSMPGSEALCGSYSTEFSPWYGTGSQDEYERAAELPLCHSCAYRAYLLEQVELCNLRRFVVPGESE